MKKKKTRDGVHGTIAQRNMLFVLSVMIAKSEAHHSQRRKNPTTATKANEMELICECTVERVVFQKQFIENMPSGSSYPFSASFCRADLLLFAFSRLRSHTYEQTFFFLFDLFSHCCLLFRFSLSRLCSAGHCIELVTLNNNKNMIISAHTLARRASPKQMGRQRRRKNSFGNRFC